MPTTKYFASKQCHYTKKVNVKVKFTLEQTTKAQKGIEVRHFSFFNLKARCRWVVNATFRPFYPESVPVPIV
jgi:hypothetical protein